MAGAQLYDFDSVLSFFDPCEFFYDENNYQLAHTEQCDAQDHEDCNVVDSPLAHIMSTLDQHGIPTLALRRKKVIASKVTFGVPYVAITHVWSGGLGNPKRNAMNLCQLREIQELTALSRRTLQGFKPKSGPKGVFPRMWGTMINPLSLVPQARPEWFWIDTLNIPKVDETGGPKPPNDLSFVDDNSTSARTMSDNSAFDGGRPQADNETDPLVNAMWSNRVVAIDRMSQTYAAADWAIVLDPELRRMDLKWAQKNHDPDSEDADHDLLQMMTSILICSWMSRAWTYQEGAMAKELMVKFRSQTLLPIRVARSDLLTRNRRRQTKGVYGDVHDMLDEVSAWYSDLPTSRDDDAAVGRKQISAGGEDGLKAILMTQTKLPVALLFQGPLTRKERVSERKEFQKEQRPKRSGVIRSPGTMRIQLTRYRAESAYVYFNNISLEKGSQRPQLYRLQPGSFNRDSVVYTVKEESFNCVFTLKIRSQFSDRDSAPLVVRTFRHLCAVSCTGIRPGRRQDILGPLLRAQAEQFLEGTEYRIDCDFRNVSAPSNHRIHGFLPTWITTFDVLSTIMLPLVLYYLLVFSLMCPAAFTHGPGSFPRGWLALIGFFMMMRLLSFAWNNMRGYAAAAERIQFTAWVNGIDNNAAPVVDLEKRYTGFSVHMSPRDTIMVLTIRGALVGELLFRWGLEIWLPTSIFWGPTSHAGLPEHETLRQVYMSSSWLTRRVKAMLGRR
ncbi:hypothetical protein DV736_g533, partial [Chaetothyriales sp. CBS 134916]